MKEQSDRYQRALKNDFQSEFLEFESHNQEGHDSRDYLGKRLYYWR
jgi:hypothetical protein